MTECPVHPGVEAVGTCERCGRFYCATEAHPMDGRVYCAACAERPEVNWLTHHYAALEGKRSGLAWFSAGLGVVGLLLGGGMLAALGSIAVQLRGSGESLGALRWVLGPVGIIAWSLTALAVWTGRRWALTANLLGAVLAAALLGLANENTEAQLLVGGLMLLLALLFHAVLRREVRTRLFFRLPVERGALRQHYERYGSNWQASSAARLAALGLVVPGLGFISLGLAVWGLARVDRRAVPPIGGLGSAVGAALLSALSCVGWGFVLFH